MCTKKIRRRRCDIISLVFRQKWYMYVAFHQSGTFTMFSIPNLFYAFLHWFCICDMVSSDRLVIEGHHVALLTDEHLLWAGSLKYSSVSRNWDQNHPREAVGSTIWNLFFQPVKLQPTRMECVPHCSVYYSIRTSLLAFWFLLDSLGWLHKVLLEPLGASSSFWLGWNSCRQMACGGLPKT